jgi:hypothetical protein
VHQAADRHQLGIHHQQLEAERLQLARRHDRVENGDHLIPTLFEPFRKRSALGKRPACDGDLGAGHDSR